MFRHFSLGLVASIAAICPTSVSAEEVQEIQKSPQSLSSEEWSFPENSIFLGIGLGTSIVSYDTQYLYNLGLSRIYKNDELVAIGGADGPAMPNPPSRHQKTWYQQVRLASIQGIKSQIGYTVQKRLIHF